MGAVVEDSAVVGAVAEGAVVEDSAGAVTVEVASGEEEAAAVVGDVAVSEVRHAPFDSVFFILLGEVIDNGMGRAFSSEAISFPV